MRTAPSAARGRACAGGAERTPARPSLSPSARSASASAACGSWLVSTRVQPLARPISGSISSAARRVEVGARLVEQQQRGVVQHRAADGERAGPCRGESSRTASSARRSIPTALEQLVDPLLRDAVQAGVVAQVLARRSGRGRAAARAPSRPSRPRTANARLRQRLAEHARPRRRAGAAAWRGSAAASTCRRRCGPRTASVAPGRHASPTRRAARSARRSGGPGRAAQWPAVVRPPSRCSVATTCCERRRDHREQLADRLRVAGEVDDQRAARDPRHAAREDPHRRVLQRLGAHRLREAGRLALDHRPGRLRRHVVGRQAGAAGGEDQRDVAGDDMPAQAILDRGRGRRAPPRVPRPRRRPASASSASAAPEASSVAPARPSVEIVRIALASRRAYGTRRSEPDRRQCPSDRRTSRPAPPTRSRRRARCP